MQLFRQNKTYRYVYGFLPFFCCLPLPLFAEELTPFKLTGIEGNVGISYQTDELLAGQVGQTKSRNALSTTREDVFILTHSYIYHPNLLSVDLGGGINFVQSELESPAGNVETDDDLDTLTAKLRFLEKKPYPFTLYYDRTNPMVSPSITERFIQENERYGMNASVNQPLLPFSINLEAFHTSNKGSGITRIVDDSSDQVLFRAYRTIGKDGYGQLTYHNNQRESLSGISTIALQHTDITSESTSFDTHFSFGEQNQFRLSNLFSWFTQDNLPDQKEFRFVPNLSWQHSKDFSTYYRLDYLDSEIDTVKSENRSAAIGGRMNVSETVAVTAEVHGSSNQIGVYDSSSKGFSGSISYLKPLSIGRLSLSMGLGYDEASQNGGLVTAQEEKVTLTAVQTPLQHDFVSSVIQVRTEVGSQLLTETTPTVQGDYILKVIGSTTYILWDALGSVPSGTVVYVTYVYDSGPTVTYSTFNQSYHAALDFLKYYSIYADFSDSSIDQKEGTSDQLTSVQRTRTGFRVEHPFWDEVILLGGEAVRENQDDDFSPYDRDTLEVFVEAELMTDSRLRVTGRTVQQDNLVSVEDIDLERESIRLTMHPWPRSTLTFEVSNEKDTGGSIYRRSKEKSVVGRWRIRKLVFEIDGRSILETQGENEREHNLLTARLNREF